MPTGIVPPTGFVCFLPRRNVLMLDMTIEDAAKVIISAGMVTPESQAKLRELAEQAKRKNRVAEPLKEKAPRPPKITTS
jgi:uncharacterized membrane protein